MIAQPFFIFFRAHPFLFFHRTVGALPMCAPSDEKIGKVRLSVLMWLCGSHSAKCCLSLIGACASLSAVGRSMAATYHFHPLRIFWGSANAIRPYLYIPFSVGQSKRYQRSNILNILNILNVPTFSTLSTFFSFSV